MSKVPHDLRFLKSHEWARLETDGTVTVGISDHAQGLLGDLVYVGNGGYVALVDPVAGKVRTLSAPRCP